MDVPLESVEPWQETEQGYEWWWGYILEGSTAVPDGTLQLQIASQTDIQQIALDPTDVTPVIRLPTKKFRCSATNSS